MSETFLTEDHRRLREQVAAFAAAEIAPHVPRMETTRAVEHDLTAAIAAQGWIGVTIDPEYGGMGAGHLAKTIIIEELSRVSGAMGTMVQASQLGAGKIILYGSDEQKRAWLPHIAAGTCLPTIAVTEPGSGGHVAGMEGTARRSGKGFILNGCTKVYVGNSHVGHVHGVVARTGEGSGGLSAFLVEADRPGLTLRPHIPSMGLHGFSYGDLVLDDCRVPAANLIGKPGDGQAVAYSSSVLFGRPNLTAVALGIHQAIMDLTTTFVQERRRYGGPLADLDTVRDKLGLMQHRLMTARLTAYHAVYELDHGLARSDANLINAKFLNVKSLWESAQAAMEIHAAAGLRTDYPLERFFRDAFHLYAPAGTGDVQILRLAEHALGTRHQPWSVRHAHLLAHPDTARAVTSTTSATPPSQTSGATQR